MEKNNQSHLMMEMLIKVEENDAGLKQLIAQQISKKNINEEEEKIAKEIIRCLRIQNKKLLDQVESLKGRLKSGHADTTQITNRLTYLKILNNKLSEALGSCPKCWGDDMACLNCYGKGAPGWRPVDKRLFYLYVLPTLERLYGMNK